MATEKIFSIQNSGGFDPEALIHMSLNKQIQFPLCDFRGLITVEGG